MAGTKACTTKRDIIPFLLPQQPHMHSRDKVAPFRTRVSISDAVARTLRGNLNPTDSPRHNRCNRLRNHMPRRRTCSHIRHRTAPRHRTMPRHNHNSRQRLLCSRSRLQLQLQLNRRTTSSNRISSHNCRPHPLRPPLTRSPRRRGCPTNLKRTHHLRMHPHRLKHRLKSRFNPNPNLRLSRKCRSSSRR